MGNAGTVLNVTTVIIVVVCGQLFVAVVMVYLLAKMKKDIIANIYRKDKLIDMGFGALEIGILGKINEAINRNFIQREEWLKKENIFSCTNPTCKKRKLSSRYLQDRLDTIGRNAYERRYCNQRSVPEKPELCKGCQINDSCETIKSGLSVASDCEDYMPYHVSEAATVPDINTIGDLTEAAKESGTVICPVTAVTEENKKAAKSVKGASIDCADLMDDPSSDPNPADVFKNDTN